MSIALLFSDVFSKLSKVFFVASRRATRHSAPETPTNSFFASLF